MLPNIQTKRNLAILVIAACVLTAALTVAAWAKKPGKPPRGGRRDEPLTGTIYFSVYGELHTMDPDGSNKTPLPLRHAAGVCTVGSDCFGEPSQDLHGGHRWFVQIDRMGDELYPDGRPRLELFAARDDEAIRLPLTDNPNLAASYNSSVSWAVDAEFDVNDGMVSWVAMLWEYNTTTQQNEIVEAGIYCARIEFDYDGNVVGLSEEPWLLVPTTIFSTYGTPVIYDHDWSPDGTKIVYQTWKDTSTQDGLFIVNLLTGETSRLTSGYAFDPRWSPDGQKIVFRSSHTTIDTINTDGTNQTTIVAPRKADLSGMTKVDFVLYARWSPSGTHLVYLYALWKRSNHPGHGGPIWNVYRARADGEYKTNLTSDMDATVYPVAWR